MWYQEFSNLPKAEVFGRSQNIQPMLRLFCLSLKIAQEFLKNVLRILQEFLKSFTRNPQEFIKSSRRDSYKKMKKQLASPIAIQ